MKNCALLLALILTLSIKSLNGQINRSFVRQKVNHVTTYYTIIGNFSYISSYGGFTPEAIDLYFRNPNHFVETKHEPIQKQFDSLLNSMSNSGWELKQVINFEPK